MEKNKSLDMWILRCLQDISGKELRAANTDLGIGGLQETLTLVFSGR